MNILVYTYYMCINDYSRPFYYYNNNIGIGHRHCVWIVFPSQCDFDRF